MTRNQRWLCLMLLLTLLGSSPLLVGAVVDRLAPPYVPPEQPEWIVQRGDTLWQIAVAAYPEEVHRGRAVQAIKEANGLSSSVIHPGQRLRLPEVRAGE